MDDKVEYDHLFLIGKFCERNKRLLEEIKLQIGIDSQIIFLGKCRSDSAFKISNQSRYIILIDALELDYSTLESYLHFILSKTYRCSIIIFNLPKNSELESIVCWPRVQGIVFKGKKDKTVIKRIYKVMQGKLCLPKSLILNHFLKNRQLPVMKDYKNIFTHRELQILRKISLGASNKVIASELALSNHTIKTHIYNLFKKIRVTNRIQAVIWARKHSCL